MARTDEPLRTQSQLPVGRLLLNAPAPKRRFDYTDAHEVQGIHLAEWRDKLNAECFHDLVQEVRKRNAIGYSHPMEVWRGSAMTEFVVNWKPGRVSR